MTTHEPRPGAGMLPLLQGCDDLDVPLAWDARGQPLSRRQYLRDVRRLAAALPAGGPVLAMTADRYRFALVLGAAAVRGQASLMPPNHTPDTVARVRLLFPRAHAVSDGQQATIDLPTIPFPSMDTDGGQQAQVPLLPGHHEVAQILTSGSTGQPVPHGKRWDLMVANVRGGAARLAEHLGRADLRGVTVVGTVPAHHMFGFEQTVLIGLVGGATFASERPFFATDIARVLAAAPRPRMLVTTPLHLKTLLDAGIALPAVDLVLSATAPLSPQLAVRAEATLGAPLVEIYGCTEAGQVATRRTAIQVEWQTHAGIVLAGDGDEVVVSGGHVPEPTRLADVLEVLSPTRFRLLGRSNDLINVAGKRSSLSHLNHHLNSIAGVQDGAFWLPPETGREGVVRLVAFVVAPGVERQALLDGLRERVDAAFLPRRMVWLDSLPRDETGKLPASRLAELGERLVGSGGRG